MKIYTKSGDQGKTKLFGGEVVGKDNIRVEVYGTLDELNSMLGFILTFALEKKIKSILLQVQNDLFGISSELATTDNEAQKNLPIKIGMMQISRLEEWIDDLDQQMRPLTHFILPGGTASAAGTHLGRTICRRAERILVKLMYTEVINKNILIYLNRLSDLLFVMARFMNQQAAVAEVPWPAPQTSED